MSAIDRHRDQLKTHKFKRVCCLDFATGGIISDRCDALKLTRIIRTPRGSGNGVITYAIDGVAEEFDTLGTAVECLEKIGVLP